MKLSYTTWFNQQFTDNDGNPLSNGHVWTYKAGTSILATTYNEAGNVNANPVHLDADGRAVIRIDVANAYKFLMYDSNNNLIDERDNIYGAESASDITTNDHSALVNRDQNDQHPISAITGLESYLTTLGVSVSALSLSVSALGVSVSALDTALAGKVSNSGDTMTGALNFDASIGSGTWVMSHDVDADNYFHLSANGLDAKYHGIKWNLFSDLLTVGDADSETNILPNRIDLERDTGEECALDSVSLLLTRSENNGRILLINGVTDKHFELGDDDNQVVITETDLTFNGESILTDKIALVAVDGVTITGDGTAGNPLVSVGGGGSAGTRKFHGVYRNDDGTYESADPTFNTSTRELSFPSPFHVWIKGVEFTIPAGVVGSIPNTVGQWLFYHDGTSIVSSQTFPDISRYALIHRGYWTGSEWWGKEERHGYDYGAWEHVVDHFGIGTAIHGTKPTIADYVLQPASPTDSNNQYSITAHSVQDEDIIKSIPAYTATTQRRLAYKNSTVWARTTSASNHYFFYQVGGRIQYNLNQNSTGSLVQVDSGKYVNYYIIDTLDIQSTDRLTVVAGARQFDDPFTASSADITTDLFTNDVDAYEYYILWRVTYGVNDSYGTTGKCRIEAVNPLDQGRGAYNGSSSLVNINAQNLNVSNNSNLNGTSSINGTLNINANTTLSGSTRVSGAGSNRVAIFNGSEYLTGYPNVDLTELGLLNGRTGELIDTSSTNQTKNGAILARRASASLEGFGVGVTGDATSRVQVRPDGVLFGDGTSAPDVSFYRYFDLVPYLRTDVRLWFNKGIFVKGGTSETRTIETDSADTNIQRVALTLKHKTTSESTNGFGTILRFAMEDVSGVESVQGAIDCVQVNDTDGDADVYLQSANDGALVNVLRLGSDGNAEFLGSLAVDSLTASQYVKTDASKNLVSQSGVPLTDISYACACEFLYPDVKVRAVSTANLATLSGNQTVDGIALIANDFVLLKNQTTASQNGVWMVNAGAWTRAVGYDTDEEIRTRIVICTADGTTNKVGMEFLCTNTSAITVGSTSITFAQVPLGIGTGATNASAGNHTHTSAMTLTANMTARGFVITQQTNTPTGTTYTWTLTSGNHLRLTLTSSTGNVTVTTASPTLGADSVLSIAGHASATRDVILTQSGVTFRMTGATGDGTSTITLGTVPISGNGFFRLHWATATLCFIDKVYLG